jgi:hypothetical protein
LEVVFSFRVSADKIKKERIAAHLAVLEHNLASIRGATRRVDAAQRPAGSDGRDELQGFDAQRTGDMRRCVAAANHCAARTRPAQPLYDDFSGREPLVLLAAP